MKQLIKPENLQYLFREKNNDGAEFTVKSLVTGKDFTYKISRSLFNNKWYTHVYVEQGYQNFVRLGTFSNGMLTDKRVEVKTPAAQAASWLLRHVSTKNWPWIEKHVEVMHTGNCIVCGQKLTDAVSIEIGIGPICRSGKH